MKQKIDLGFAERRSAAGEAKRRLLEKVAPALKPDTPEALARRAERAAAAEARENRAAERLRLKQETAAREKAEAESRAAAEALAAAAATEDEADRLARLAADSKAERDRRYAARKERKR
jgi:hypothetical protein